MLVRTRPRTARQAFRSIVGREPGAVPFARLQPATPKPLPRESLYHYWYPAREGVEPAPRWFADRLTDLHKDLACCRPPANAPTPSHAWLVWYKVDRVTHPLCPGWSLLFVWQDRSEDLKGAIVLTPLPLDERVFANLYRISARKFGSGVKYFESVVKTMRDDKARRDAANQQYRDDRRKDYWQATKIKNIGAGSKFARHHDGTVVPSRAEANWLRERGDKDMPESVTKPRRERQRKSLSDLKNLRVVRGRR